MERKKYQYRVDFDHEFKESLDKRFKEMGISRTEAMERIAKWWLNQSPTIQAAVLGTLPEDLPMPSVAQMMLENMAKGMDLSDKGVDLSSKGVAGTLGDHEIHMDQAARDFGDEEEQTGMKC